MALTLPTLAPTGYALDRTDFLKIKADRSGAGRLQSGTVAIPASTASATLIGLMPFDAGFKVHGLVVYVDDLDSSTNITLSVGYTYYDSATGSSSASGFVSASTTAQSGGRITMTGSSILTFTAAGQGWLTATTGGGATTTSGNLLFNCSFAYDSSGVTNA